MIIYLVSGFNKSENFQNLALELKKKKTKFFLYNSNKKRKK